MVRNSIRNSVVSIIVLFCVAISTMPAYASWESGINVITTVDGDLNEKQTFDTPEDYTTEVMRLVNAERANDGLPELSCSDTLVLPADIRAKELYNTNRLLVTKLANLLGDDILSDTHHCF